MLLKIFDLVLISIEKGFEKIRNFFSKCLETLFVNQSHNGRPCLERLMKRHWP